MEEGVLAAATEGAGSSFATLQDKVHTWWESGIALLPNLVVALIVVVVFGLLAKLARSLVRRLVARVTTSQSIPRLLATLANITVLMIGLFVALGVLQLDKTVTSLLAGAGVVGIALAFAFQDVAANLIAGVYLSFQKPMMVGDLIDTQDVEGKVDAIDLRTTRLRTTDGRIVLIPNKEIFENVLINLSRSGKRRVDVAVGVSYGEDLRRVKSIAHDAIAGLEMRDTDQGVEIFFEGFGSSSIDLVARFWIDFERMADYKAGVSQAIIALKEAFDANDIMIPFPIRTLDFGIKGGQPLAEALPDLGRRDSGPAGATQEGYEGATRDQVGND